MRRVLESWPELRRRFPGRLLQFGALRSWQQLERALAAYTYRAVLCIERFYCLVQFLRHRFDLVFSKIVHRPVLLLDRLTQPVRAHYITAPGHFTHLFRGAPVRSPAWTRGGRERHHGFIGITRTMEKHLFG